MQVEELSCDGPTNLSWLDDVKVSILEGIESLIVTAQHLLTYRDQLKTYLDIERAKTGTDCLSDQGRFLQYALEVIEQHCAGLC